MLLELLPELAVLPAFGRPLDLLVLVLALFLRVQLILVELVVLLHFLGGRAELELAEAIVYDLDLARRAGTSGL